jgi:hypothetical protein
MKHILHIYLRSLTLSEYEMIIKAIDRAYRVMKERNWDTIYWAIDLHGVCFKSTYETSTYEWINDNVVPSLLEITSHPENKIILWSGVHDFEKPEIIKFFELEGIHVDFFNCNPLEDNTLSGNFAEKFYFNILLDDKAGFDPDIDWDIIRNYWKTAQGATDLLIEISHDQESWNFQDHCLIKD